MSKTNFSRSITRLVKSRDRVPDEFWSRTAEGRFMVLWFLDRQKPSVHTSYDFDCERFGVTKEGHIIWASIPDAPDRNHGVRLTSETTATTPPGHGKNSSSSTRKNSTLAGRTTPMTTSRTTCFS